MLTSQSNDHLHEILIQKNINSESSMRIDFRNRTDNIVVFIFALVLLILIFVTTLFGERHFLKTNYKLNFLPNSRAKSKLIHINGLNCYNLFISLSVTLFRNFSSKNRHLMQTLSSINQNKIKISTSVMNHYDKSQSFMIYNSSSNIIFPFQKLSHQKSETKIIFYDQNVYRSSYFFQIRMKGNLSEYYSGCQITCTNGNRSLTFVLIAIRSSFFITLLIITILFASKTKNDSYTEQKATLALIIFAFLTDFPTADIHRSEKTFFLVLICSIISSLFNVFSRFYITVIFNSVRMQKKQISRLEYLMIFSLFSVLAVINAVSTVSYEYSLQHFTLINRKMTKIFVEISCDTIILILIAQTALSIDETEVFRFIFYFVHSVLAIFISGTSTIIQCFDISIDVKTTMEMMQFASLNIFVIVMSYAHWPCIMNSNRKYNPSPQDSQQKIIIDDEI